MVVGYVCVSDMAADANGRANTRACRVGFRLPPDCFTIIINVFLNVLLRCAFIFFSRQYWTIRLRPSVAAGAAASTSTLRGRRHCHFVFLLIYYIGFLLLLLTHWVCCCFFYRHSVIVGGRRLGRRRTAIHTLTHIYTHTVAYITPETCSKTHTYVKGGLNFAVSPLIPRVISH